MEIDKLKTAALTGYRTSKLFKATLNNIRLVEKIATDLDQTIALLAEQGVSRPQRLYA